MKYLKKFIWMFSLLLGISVNAQITFNACNSLIENQNYTFNQTSTVDGRNVFETSPITGDQDCGGIGVCEMQIAWNTTNSRWEIFADDGNGTFTNKLVLYYNMEASLPNPPSLILGTWVENSPVTQTLCGGDLTTVNAILTGDVQDNTLSISNNELLEGFEIYPNPAKSVISIRANNLNIETITISDINGRIVLFNLNNTEQIDISKLQNGLYFVELQTKNRQLFKKLIVK